MPGTEGVWANPIQEKPGIIDRPMVRRKVVPESRWSQLLSCDKRQYGVRRSMATERKTAACTTSACMLKLQQEKHKIKKERRRRKEKTKEAKIRRQSTYVALELLASWATPEPRPTNRTAYTGTPALIIMPQRHTMTQVAQAERTDIRPRYPTQTKASS